MSPLTNIEAGTVRPEQQAVLNVERIDARRERLSLGCGCTIERAIRKAPRKPSRAVCPDHDKRPTR